MTVEINTQFFPDKLPIEDKQRLINYIKKNNIVLHNEITVEDVYALLNEGRVPRYCTIVSPKTPERDLGYAAQQEEKRINRPSFLHEIFNRRRKTR